MNYKEETQQKAIAEISRRKRLAESIAQRNRADFMADYPRALEIERILQSTGSQAARAVLSGGDVKENLSKLRDISLSIQKEYQELLTKARLTESDIEPQYSCKLCGDTGYRDGYMCSCYKDLLKKYSYEELNNSTPLEMSGFENFSTEYFKNFTPAQQKLMEKNYNFCKYYADTFSKNSDSLLLLGATGLGKTHLSLAIAKEVVNKGFGVIYGTVQSFAVTIEKGRYVNNGIDISLSQCDLLILDDLGTEFSAVYTQSVIYDIINTRIMRKLPTIITTNLSAEALQKRYGERMISRFFGSYNSIQFVGKDIRVIKKFRTQNTE